MHPREKTLFKKFLSDNLNVFAWAPINLPGTSPSIICHKLSLKTDAKLVKQKPRRMNEEWSPAISDEDDRLLQADFIRETFYPDWLSNSILMKTNGKWVVCIDFTNLNKACPKDSFPLPRIDQLIEAMTGHEFFSFMDAYFGFNQIKMHSPDEDKTAFTTNREIYCYKVIPFRLKNFGATFHRMVDKVFKDMIGRTMEVYVDDMLVKSSPCGSPPTFGRSLRPPMEVQGEAQP